MTRAFPERLTGFIAAVLEAEGVPAADAGLVARCLVQAELWGHPSHEMLGWAGMSRGSAPEWWIRPPSPRRWSTRARWRCSMGVGALAMS